MQPITAALIREPVAMPLQREALQKITLGLLRLIIMRTALVGTQLEVRAQGRPVGTVAL